MTDTLTNPPSRRTVAPSAIGWLVVTATGAALAAYLGLHDVPGAVLEPGSSTDYTTTFVNDTWNLAWLLALPVWLATRSHFWIGLAAVLVAVVPQYFVAAEVVRRAGESGWGDGLEGLAYLNPVAMTVVFGIAWLVGFLVPRVAR